jgi:hypothetical protein
VKPAAAHKIIFEISIGAVEWHDSIQKELRGSAPRFAVANSWLRQYLTAFLASTRQSGHLATGQ